MNKALIGLMIIIVGGLVGWYIFRGSPKGPGMKIGGDSVNQNPATGSSDVTISDESFGGGNQKGGVTGEVVISYTDSGYQPAAVTVAKGTKVTFKNESNGAMWTASGMHPTHLLLPGFDELKSVANGGTYEYTFIKVGTWKYHNHVKPADEGTVTVTE